VEPEVHIIERYFQIVLNCFTMPNVRCKGNKEIDLLAVDPKTQVKYHVESRVWLKQTLHLEDIDSLAKEKFEHPIVREKIQKLFGNSKYRKWLVIQPQKVDSQLDDFARDKFGIEIQYIDTILRMIMRKISSTGSRNDVLRTLELVNLIREFDQMHTSKIILPKLRYRKS